MSHDDGSSLEFALVFVKEETFKMHGKGGTEVVAKLEAYF
jgi:hypothetical protein